MRRKSSLNGNDLSDPSYSVVSIIDNYHPNRMVVIISRYWLVLFQWSTHDINMNGGVLVEDFLIFLGIYPYYYFIKLYIRLTIFYLFNLIIVVISSSSGD